MSDSTSSSLATTPVRFNQSAFVAFFNREHAQGARLAFVQRTSIGALSKLGLEVAKIAELTSSDPGQSNAGSTTLTKSGICKMNHDLVDRL